MLIAEADWRRSFCAGERVGQSASVRVPAIKVFRDFCSENKSNRGPQRFGCAVNSARVVGSEAGGVVGLYQGGGSGLIGMGVWISCCDFFGLEFRYEG